VYYFVTAAGDRAYLLPMRVVGFARLVRRIEAQTGLDMQDVKPLAQPWMYLILLGLTIMLLAVDAWTITTAVSVGAVGFG
jgi:heme/copper-type cytochrome/quinol oxidase subunit 1